MKEKLRFAMLLLLVSALFLTPLTAQGSKESADTATGPEGTLVVYSTMFDDEFNMIADAFTEKYPDIDMQVVQAGAGEIKTRVEAEKANAQGDVMFGGLLYSDFVSKPELWETYVSANDSEFPAQFQNTTGKFTWVTTQVVNLLVNKEIVKELGIEVNGYADLLQPELKGKIVSADPTASSSAWRQLTTMLVVMGDGDYESDKAWNYIDALVQNMDGVMTSSSSAVYKGTFAGEYAVGITYEAPCVKLVEEGYGDVVEIVYMEEGTTMAPFASAIIKGAKNMDNAKLFIDFVSSNQAQKLWAASTARQANINLPTTNTVLTPVDQMKIIPEDLEYIAVNQEKIKDHFTDIWAMHN